MKTCSTCLGSGFIAKFVHIENGKCFQCNGTGKVERTTTSERLQHLEAKFVNVEARYLKDKQVIENAMNDFKNGIIDAFQLSDICKDINLMDQKKNYEGWIKAIEEEKKLIAAL